MRGRSAWLRRGPRRRRRPRPAGGVRRGRGKGRHDRARARGDGRNHPRRRTRWRRRRGGGPEAAARTARHAALHGAALRLGRPLLLAHTLDDQAETVLLGLARGAGATALSGMDPDRTWDDGVRVVRPLLGLRRADTEAVCDELGLEPWHDPHNADPRFARVRARATALPMLEELLGPGIAENLARTADLLRADARASMPWPTTHCARRTNWTSATSSRFPMPCAPAC
nr:tRNA lysidine(34) synthetase [Corynebacterium xerosis]